MKLPRYSSRALPRTAVIDPATAARAAAAPFQAAATGLAVAAQTVDQIDRYNKAAEAAEFEIERSTMETDQKLAMQKFATDEKWQADEQEDGRDTPTAMQFEAEEIFRGMYERAGELAERAPDDITRKQIMADVDNAVKLQRAEVESAARKRRNQMMNNKVASNINNRVEMGNFDGARFEVERGLEMGVLSEESAAAARVDIRKAEVARTTQALTDEYFGRAAVDMDNADEWVKKNIMTLEDTDVRKAAMAQISTTRNQIRAANAAERSALTAQHINNYRGDARNAKKGAFSAEQAALNYEQGNYGEPDTPEAAQRYNAVLDSIKQQVAEVDKIAELEAYMQVGLVEYTKDNQKTLDRVLANRVAAAPEGSDPNQIASDLFREAGMVSHMTNVMLSQAANSPEQAMRAYQTYKNVVADGERKPRMSISDDAANVLAEMHSRVAGAGYSEDEAIETVFAIREQNIKNPGLVDARREEFSNEDNVEAFEDATIGYVEGLLEAQFPGAFQITPGAKTGGLRNRLPSFSTGPGAKNTPIPEHMMTMISTAASDHYALYGRMEGAMQFALDRAEEKYKLNNLNGDWQFQFMGLEGDVAQLGEISKRDIIAAGGDHWVRDQGTWTVKRLSEKDMERITFEPILTQREEGATEYMVMFDGSPINRQAPQAGVTPEFATFTFSEGVEQAYHATVDHRARLTELQREIDVLERRSASAEARRQDPEAFAKKYGSFNLAPWNETDQQRLITVTQERDALFERVSQQLEPHRSSAYGAY